MGRPKKVKEAGPEKGSKHLTRADLCLIVDWLELPESRSKLDGVGGKTKVGAKPMLRAKALEEMAKYVNDHQKKGSQLPTVETKSMRTRWRHYRNRYLAAKKLSQQTGFGVTEKDQAIGITTVEQKLEYECPWYGRLDALFKDQPNVDPHAEFQGGAASLLEAELERELEEDDDAEGFEFPDERAQVAQDIRRQGRTLSSEEQFDLDMEVGRDPFVPDSVPINEGDCVPDSIPPPEDDSQAPPIEANNFAGSIFGQPDLVARNLRRQNGHEVCIERAANDNVNGLDEAPARPTAQEDNDQLNPERGRAQVPPPEPHPEAQPQREQSRSPASGQSTPQRGTVTEGEVNSAEQLRAPGCEGLGAGRHGGNSRRPEVNSRRQEANGGQRASGSGRGLPRQRSMSVNIDRPYPNKKQIGDNRHSINGAFANNLETTNMQRERANELRAQRLELDRELLVADRADQRIFDEKKLEWEKVRFEEEKQAKAKTEVLQMKMALISSKKSYQEIKDLLSLMDDGL